MGARFGTTALAVAITAATVTAEPSTDCASGPRSHAGADWAADHCPHDGTTDLAYRLPKASEAVGRDSRETQEARRSIAGSVAALNSAARTALSHSSQEGLSPWPDQLAVDTPPEYRGSK
jgi:hypothetical protein